MSRGIFPPAYWDVAKKVCRDIITHLELPNYEGLCLFSHNGRSMIMTTGTVGGERHWEVYQDGPFLTT